MVALESVLRLRSEVHAGTAPTRLDSLLRLSTPATGLRAAGYDKGSIGNPQFGGTVGVDTVDLATAVQRVEDPPIVIGSDALGGVWLSFNADREGIMTIEVDDSVHPCEVEAWVGPNYAVGMRNLRLIEWSGGAAQPLAAVMRLSSPQVQPDDLSGPQPVSGAPWTLGALQVRPGALAGVS